MKIIDPSTQNSVDNYRLLTSTVIPRPIAWITSLSEDRVVNAAPFSFFNVVSSNPPMLCVSVGRRDGQPKDTTVNIAYTKEFVVHIVDESLAVAMNMTAAHMPPEESELELAGLSQVESDKVKVPGIKEAKVRMECKVKQIIPITDDRDRPTSDLILGRVVCLQCDEELYEDGMMNVSALKPISRLGGNEYAKLGELLRIDRPS